MSKKSKKNQIKESALSLFSEKGYKFVTADMIVEKAGVSKGLLFFHFQSMKGLLSELLLDWLGPKWKKLANLDTSNMNLCESIELIFEMVRSNLLIHEGQYKLYYNILLNEPNLFSELKVHELDSYKEMTNFLRLIFQKSNIAKVEDEIILLSTTLIGLEVQYCIIDSKVGLKHFDVSKKLFLQRYERFDN